MQKLAENRIEFAYREPANRQNTEETIVQEIENVFNKKHNI